MKLIVSLSLLLLILAAGDVLTTYVGITTEVANEQNGKVQHIFDSYGFISFAIIRMVTIGAVIGIFLYFYNKGLTATASLALIGLNGILMLVIVSNLIVILGGKEIYHHSSNFPVFVILTSLIIIFSSLMIDDITGQRKRLLKA